VGNTAVLSSQPPAGPYIWTQFYGTWMSGPTTTTANIYINDLQSALGGNDFGLDDISFGTLSTFINLESAPGTDSQVVCRNTPLTNISYSVGNGNPSGPNVSGLPNGVTSVFTGDHVNISGTPTDPAGKYTYKITTTGCAPQTITGTITVQEQTLVLSSGNSSPIVCVNAPVNIGYTAGGTATSATVTGLPAGFTISGFPVVTISGSIATAGIYPYKIFTAGTCTPDTLTGTITVRAASLTLTSAPVTSNQTLCVNTAITNIVYTASGPVTGVTASGLPSGVTTSYNGGIFTISGTPTASGTFNYTVTATGSCGNATATGSISVTPAAAIALSSAPGTDAQTACDSLPITNITYTVSNATGAFISSGTLPAGVTGSFAGGVFTISGTPTAGGVFTYKVTTTGGCATATVQGTITVDAQKIVLTSGSASQSLCQSGPMAPVKFTISGKAIGATVSGLPNGLSGSLTGNVFTISGVVNDVAGTYNYTVTTSGSCKPTSIGGTITVQAAPVGGTLTSTSSCGGGNGTLTLAGNSPSVVQWESSTDGTTWTVIANTTISYNYSNIMVPTMFRVKVGNNCGTSYSTIATVSIRNYWTGGTSNDWNTASNWSDNTVPNGTCPDVYIPGGTTFEPLISTGTVTIQNITIKNGGSLTVSNSILQIGGAITTSGASFINAVNGTIEMNGTTAQTIPAVFQANDVKNLIISNTAGVTLSGTVDIYGSLNFGKSGSILNTGGHLAIKSNASGTAWIGDMTNHTINGNVTVERYIPTGAGHGKAWEFLATPTKGQTVFQSWMENGITTSTGYGTQVTGAAGLGFDMDSPAPSMKYYDPTNATGYTGVASAATQLYDARGYMIFVRGDRSVDGVNNKTANPTTLRSTGTLLTGPQTTAVPANKEASIGNPYAAPLDMTKVLTVNSTGVNEFFTIWNSTQGGQYGYGIFQTYSRNPVTGDYNSTPGNIKNNFIQSGEAFLVQATGSAGNLVINETSKANASGGFISVFRPMGGSGKIAELRTNLYRTNSDATNSLLDGTLQQLNNDYSNAVDGMDARKMFNSSENISIKTGGKYIIIERRKLFTPEDTVFYSMSNLHQGSYKLEFVAGNLANGVEGYIEDTYLKTRIVLNPEGTTQFTFAVTGDAGTYRTGRFRIVFRTAAALPVTFVSVKATAVNTDIAVEWKVENESQMLQYEVEKSIDGVRFNKLATVPANNHDAGSYNWIDQNASAGYNYYRIRSIGMDGKAVYTQTVKVLMEYIVPDIRIYPNPIMDGVINIQMINQPGGLYQIRLLNPLGQLIASKQITRIAGSNSEHLNWNYNLAHGTYQMEIIKPDGTLKIIKVLY
jgi:hypothetical protein